MFWILSLIVLFSLAEIAAYLIYRRKTIEGIKTIYKAALGRKRVRDDIRTFSLRYAEHPFLAFTLNPEFRNSFGEKIHNKYGFRDNGDFEDIDKENDIVIYCAGESSTYCNFLERNEDAWPSVLEAKLSETIRDKKVRVINGACPGWTSYQSLIRFSAWVDVLKPKLVVIYHGKNDFGPFANTKLSVKEIFPDYGNVMSALSIDAIAKKIPFLAKYTYTGRVAYGIYVNYRYSNVLAYIYSAGSETIEDSQKGLKRVGHAEWDFIMSRYKSFASLCKDRRIPVLFVTQKVVSDLYGPYIEEINRRIKLLESRRDNCFVYDFASDIRDTTDILYDSIHFTKNGARVCAEHVKDYIIDNIMLSKERQGQPCQR